MTPDQRGAIEGLAKRKGMSIDDFLGGVQQQQPQAPGKRSDAGGGGFQMAAINPRPVVEVARRVADSLGISGLINPSVPVFEPQSPCLAPRSRRKTWCVVPGCERRTMLMSGKGLSGRYCKLHIQFKARHGSMWHCRYSATDLKPYLRVASSYIKGSDGQRYRATRAGFMSGS